MWLLQYVIGTKDAGQATPITDKLRATLAVGMWGGGGLGEGGWFEGGGVQTPNMSLRFR